MNNIKIKKIESMKIKKRKSDFKKQIIIQENKEEIYF